MPSKAKPPQHFGTTSRDDVPTGRIGKHNAIVNAILKDLVQLPPGRSLKIPLSELPDTKVNIRSALNRETRKLKLCVETATDEKYLYVWNSDAEPGDD